MGKSVELKLIEDELSRQLSFAKRRNGLMKKALELFMVCDLDCIFITFSPSGRLSFFSGDKRVEDVLGRFAALPENVQHFHVPNLKVQEFLHVVAELRDQTEEYLQNDRSIVALRQQITWVKQEIERVKAELRAYEPVPEEITTIEEANMYESLLEKTLAKVEKRKKELNIVDDENDASLNSDFTAGTENPSANQPNDQDPMHNYSSMQVALNQHSPFPSLSLEMASPYSRQAGMSFSSLLQSTNVDEISSPIRETIPPSLGIPLMLSSQLPELTNNGSIQPNQFGLFWNGGLNTHFFLNGNSAGADQSSEYERGEYRSPDGQNFYTSIPSYPSNDFQNPSMAANIYSTPQLMQFQPEFSPAFTVPPMQFPYCQLPLEEISNAPPLAYSSWNSDQSYPEPTYFGTRGGFQDVLNSSVAGPDNMFLDAGTPIYPGIPNLREEYLSREGHSWEENMNLNLQGPLTSSTLGEMQRNNIMSVTLDHFEAGESSTVAQKRKLPWEDDIVLRLLNNENENADPNDRRLAHRY